MRDKNTILLGALVGALMTAPLMAVLYFGHQVWGFPYPPKDLFDWVARVLPGDLITVGIDSMVALIDKLNLGATDSTAKLFERLMAAAQFFAGGVIIGIVLALLLRRTDSARKGLERAFSLIAAAVLALPLIVISWHMNYNRGVLDTVTDLPAENSSILWLAIIFLIWAAYMSWAFYRLRRTPGESAPAAPAEDPSARVEVLNRRQFLVMLGGATATITLIGAGLGRWLSSREDEPLPERAQDVDTLLQNTQPQPSGTNYLADLQPAPGTRPEYTPLEDHYRIDINLDPPEIDEAKWRLKITGLVDTELELTLDEIRANYEPINQVVTLACISNRIAGDLTSTTLWTGARLKDVLADAGVMEGATHLLITSADGFFETVALEEVYNDDRIMLCYAWDGRERLLQKHGFPLRIYLPDRYGMKQPKWITSIEVTDHDEDGYWVIRGWDKVARMRATSVIDTVATDSVFERADGVKLIPVGGIAHAGARGVSKVEVKVDDGDWVEAQLKMPLSETAWVVWRYDWPFEAGDHTFAVRCYEGDGTMQITENRSTKPSGATGIHTRSVSV